MADKKKKHLGISPTKILWVVLPALMVFVSITSFIAGMNLNATDQPMGRIIDTIILSPDQKLQSLDVSGRLAYSDGSPYANQLLELHSTPVQTRTDEDGRFTFPEVVLGSHTLYLLDEGGEIVSSLALYVERTPEEKAGSVGAEGDGYRIVAGMDTTALFLSVQISSDRKIKIENEILALTSDGTVKNQDGEVAGTAVNFSKGIIEAQSPVPSGEGLIEPETASEGLSTDVTAEAEGSKVQESEQRPGESGALPQQESAAEGMSGEAGQTESIEAPKKETGGNSSGGSGSSGVKPTKPTIPPPPETTSEETRPSEPETTPEVTRPEETTPEATTPEETTPEETTPEETTTEEPTAEMENITVSDATNEAWTQNTTIELFANRTGIGPDKKLAPGSTGSYEFKIANGNDFNIHYTITVEKGDNQTYMLPLSYRLKSDDGYVSGSSTTWLTAEQLKSQKVALATGGTRRYTLEWQWPYEGGNDELDTLIGMSDKLEYELVVKIQITQS